MNTENPTAAARARIRANREYGDARTAEAAALRRYTLDGGVDAARELLVAAEVLDRASRAWASQHPERFYN